MKRLLVLFILISSRTWSSDLNKATLSKPKLLQLIKQQEYAQAQTVISTTDHPTLQDALAMLNEEIRSSDNAHLQNIALAPHSGVAYYLYVRSDLYTQRNKLAELIQKKLGSSNS